MYVTPTGAVACKIVLYGAINSGRATFLQALHQHLGEDACTAIQTVDLDGVDGEEGQAFVWNSGQQVTISGRPLMATIITMSGRSRSKLARRTLVAACDAVIFVADTRRQQLDNNIDSMNDLLEHLRSHKLPEQLPMVIAYNHSDDPAALPPAQLDPLLNHIAAPSIQTVANSGKGVDAAWLTISSILVPEAENALSTLPQGPEPSLAEDGQEGWLLCCHACDSMLEVEEAAVGDVFTCGSCGATIQVINPDTGLTGPSKLPAPSGGSQHSNGDTASYGLQNIPSKNHSSYEALHPSASSTGSLGNISSFELIGFDLIKELDESPLGQRFRLYDQQKGRKARVLRVNSEVLASPGYRVQIEPYVRMAAKVVHPNLLPISALRWQGPKAYIISADAPDFEPLAQVLARRRNLGEQQAMEVLQQVALGLEEAARSGVIHGHLTPACVLVAGDGRVLLDDLGVPKAHAHVVATMTGPSPSTEYYLAPEHLLNDAPSDLRTDFFLLGCLLFRMLSAEGLVTGANAIEALNRYNATGQQRVQGFAQSLPRDIATLITRLTAADRRERFQHYGEVIEAIERCFAGLKRRTLSQTGSKRRTETGSRTRGGTGTAANPRGTRTFSGEQGGRRTRKTMPGTTTTAMRTTGAYRANRETETGLHRRGSGRRKSGMSTGGIIVIAVMAVLLILTIGYVLHLQQQHTEPLAAAPASQQGQTTSTSPSPGQESRTQEPTNPALRATRAIDAYQEQPSSESRYQTAREAVAAVTGAQRTALEHRLRGIRDQQREGVADSQAPTPPPSDGEDSTAQPSAPRDTGPSQLNAQQQVHLAQLRREQRFADARQYIADNLGNNDTRTALLQAVQGEYERAREALREAAEGYDGNREELRRLLNPALERWGMDEDDRTWAEQRIAQAPEAPSRVDDEPEREEVATSSPSDSGSSASQEAEAPNTAFHIAEQSPSGFSRAALEADSRLVSSLRQAPGQRNAANEAIASLPADDPHYPLIAKRLDLWFQRANTIQHALEQHQARLRINNPVAGGSWDVIAPTENGLVIRSPTGSSMTMRWSDISIDESANLFSQVARTQNIEGPHLAVAAVVNLVAGQRTQAARIIQGAQQGGYANAEQLQQIMQMDIDREFLDTVRSGLEAVTHRDTRALETVIEQLRTGPLAERSQTTQAIAHLSRERDTIIAGTGQDFDELSFDDPDHRNAFPLRSGWMIASGTYSSTGASSHLQRDDLGNAESLEITYSLRNRAGTFSVDFRGVTVTGNPESNRLSIQSAGLSTTQHLQLSFDTTTAYTLRMQHDPLQQNMSITVNRLDPISVRVPRPTPSLRISTTGGNEVALSHLTISRYGRRDAVHTENVARKQAALTSLGLTPFGHTIKDPDSPAIIIPEGEMMSGLGIPLREGERGISLEVTGNAPMRIRVGSLEQGAEGDSVPFVVPELGATPATIRIRIGENNWELDATQPNGERVVFEHQLPEGTNGVVILGEGLLMIHKAPESLRE